MATEDISRIAFNLKKHYASVRMQQGRVMVDDDWNENERIENEDKRRERIDIIGAYGSPDQGFKIKDPCSVNNGLIDFTVLAGTFYLGGLRLEIESDEKFREQNDWLQQSDSEYSVPTLNNNDERFDLVYLEAWQQPVSAVEDSELLEVSLGGPDTSTRIRNMRRVKIKENINSDNCGTAWQNFIADWKNKKEKQERIPATKLIVGFSGGTQDDLCSPSVQGGYLGAENQAIRVQLVDYNHFTWGFDNASPLYRVQVNANGKTVELISEIKDQAHWPIAGQVVEILPWSAKLPNKEKVAEMMGHLSKIDTSYNPDTGELILTKSINDTYNNWSSFDEVKTNGYFFMRVWNHGSDFNSQEKIPITNNPIPLGNTGIEITISGDDRMAGDYWVIAARPNSPQKVVPWGFEEGLAPHGVRRFYAPLAIIHWKKNNGNVEGKIVHHCRKIFQPLTNLESCCTYSVGDGKNSKGDFNSIEEAIKNLPEEGGVICLLPGEYETNTRIEGKQNIKIKGCDKHTKIIPSRREEPIFHIVNSQNIVLEYMDMVSLGGIPILLEASELGKLDGIEICHNRVLAFVNAIFVHLGIRINIHHNIIRMRNKGGADVAIYLLAEDSLIEYNQIGVGPSRTILPPRGVTADVPSPDDPCTDDEVIYQNIHYFYAYLEMVWVTAIVYKPENPFEALGGIQIAGGSERIKVQKNKIVGGAGNGITLGGVLPAFFNDFPGEGEEELEENIHVILHAEKRIWALVTLEGTSLSGISFLFKKEGGQTYTAGSGQNGDIVFDAEPGTYIVSLITNGYEIYNITSENFGENETRHTINLVEKEPNEIDLFDMLAFMDEIQIEENEISEMGLSGIGTLEISLTGGSTLRTNTISRILESQRTILAMLGNLVRSLTIRKNYIFNCWQNTLDEVLKKEVDKCGFGGISLRLCENVAINENRIENNGTNHNKPTCGIFVSFGEEVEVGNNRIVNNGQLVETGDMEKGKRGGIVMGVSSFSIPELLLSKTILATGRTAACIHNNIVDQPAGQALTLLAMGPLSILDNKFNSELTDSESFAGGVQIFNIGGIQNIYITQRGAARLGRTDLRLPNGNTLFNSNQTRVGSANKNIFSQLIVVLDDIGFDGNQSYNHKLEDLWANTLLLAVTLRASDNRFRERIELDQETHVLFSLLTLTTIFNNTTNNQGDHCIVAQRYPPVALPSQFVINEGNQILISGEFCETLNNFHEYNLAEIT